jgi:hypothetical protein
MLLLRSLRWVPVALLALLLAACGHGNVKTGVERQPIVHHGVGATILYPGQGPPMPVLPPTHGGPTAHPYGQGGPPPPSGAAASSPAPAGTVHPAPAPGPGGGSSITFIGGTHQDIDIQRERRSEAPWVKYVSFPFAVAFYPFKKIVSLIDQDDAPPPTRPAPASSTWTPGAPVDAGAAHEQAQLDALEHELAGRGAGSPAGGAAQPAHAGSHGVGPVASAPPAGSSRPLSIAEELASLQASIAPGRTPARAELGPASGAAPASPGLADQVSDRNRDGRPDHWIYRDHGRIVREVFDESGDGLPNRTIYYDPESGHEIRTEEDSNLDGRIDSWIDYHEGQIARHRRDTNHDGFLDTWSFYRNGILMRQEQDRTGDGYRDRVAIYESGRLAIERLDTRGDGRPDVVTIYDAEERIARRDEDADGDGLIDVRSHYEGGRLVRRELLTDTARPGIEEDELTSAAWSTGPDEADGGRAAR